MGTKCHKYIQSDAHRLTDISTVPWPFRDDTWLLTRPIFGSQHPQVFFCRLCGWAKETKEHKGCGGTTCPGSHSPLDFQHGPLKWPFWKSMQPDFRWKQNLSKPSFQMWSHMRLQQYLVLKGAGRLQQFFIFAIMKPGWPTHRWCLSKQWNRRSEGNLGKKSQYIQRPNQFFMFWGVDHLQRCG